MQCLIDGAVISISVNGGLNVGVGSTETVPAVSSFSIGVFYTNLARQNVWLGFLLVREDGLERFVGCLGLGSGFGTAMGTFTAQVSPSDPMFTTGHTVRTYLVGRFGPSPSEGQCALRTSTGEFNRAVVEGQRFLLTFVVQ